MFGKNKTVLLKLPKAQETAGAMAEVYLDGEIEKTQWYSPSKELRNLLNQIKYNGIQNVLLHINSPGGDIREGWAMFWALEQSGLNVTIRNEAFAASMAGLMMLAAPVENREAFSTSMFMIHPAWMYTAGNAQELKKDAEFLDKIDEGQKEILSKRTQATDEQIAEMTSTDYWFTAKEALEMGFISKIIDQETQESEAGQTLAKSQLKGQNPKEVFNQFFSNKSMGNNKRVSLFGSLFSFAAKQDDQSLANLRAEFEQVVQENEALAVQLRENGTTIESANALAANLQATVTNLQSEISALQAEKDAILQELNALKESPAAGNLADVPQPTKQVDLSSLNSPLARMNDAFSKAYEKHLNNF